MENLQNISLWTLTKYIAGVVAVISVFIQISPIKWNPISMLLKWMGNKFNDRIDKKIDDIRKEVVNVNSKVVELEGKVNDVRKDLTEQMNGSEEKLDRQNAVSAKRNILTFGGDLVRGVGHTEEEYVDVLHDIDDYESYCKSHPDFPNNRTVIISDRIKLEYANCLSNNSFLK